MPQFVSKMKHTLAQRGLGCELVLVANYEAQGIRPDRTPAIVAELAQRDTTIRVVAKPKQGMMGWDMRSGFAAASGKAIAVSDSADQATGLPVGVRDGAPNRGGCDSATPVRFVSQSEAKEAGLYGFAQVYQDPWFALCRVGSTLALVRVSRVARSR